MLTKQNHAASNTDSKNLRHDTTSNAVEERLAEAQLNVLPESFEKWLDNYIECPKGNFGRSYYRELRAFDKHLWDGPVTRYDGTDIVGLLFSSDDVLVLRAGEQATTREAWEQIVDTYHYHHWQEYLAEWAKHQPAPTTVHNELRDALLERWEASL